MRKPRPPIHIQHVQTVQVNTRDTPWKFEALCDAVAYSVATFKTIWALVANHNEVRFFRVYPGGRIEDHSLWWNLEMAKHGMAPDGTRLERKK